VKRSVDLSLARMLFLRGGWPPFCSVTLGGPGHLSMLGWRRSELRGLLVLTQTIVLSGTGSRSRSISSP
jgi:hypothetical protein